MINYSILASSILHYENEGFKRIESPWTVSKQVAGLTKPFSKIDYELVHNSKVLVGSGEQSFLYLYLKGFLPLGKFQTITPCFRDDTFDEMHRKYFMKNELIVTDDDNIEPIINASLRFFSNYLNSANLEVHKTNDGFDIEYLASNKMRYELGSYGKRECSFLKWIYGTGCAEPRLSSIMQIESNNQ